MPKLTETYIKLQTLKHLKILKMYWEIHLPKMLVVCELVQPLGKAVWQHSVVPLHRLYIPKKCSHRPKYLRLIIWTRSTGIELKTHYGFLKVWNDKIKSLLFNQKIQFMKNTYFKNKYHEMVAIHGTEVHNGNGDKGLRKHFKIF